MSVLINMEMPKDCFFCPFADDKLHCPLTDNTYDWRITNRPSDCPLVEIKPHGRLIDADALSEEIEKQRSTEYAMNNKPRGTWERVLELLLNMISDTPTIIEEER